MPKSHLLLLLVSAAHLFIFLAPSISAYRLYDASENGAANSSSNATAFIRSSCSATLYPERCYNSLARYANAIQDSPSQLALVAVSISLRKARRTAAYAASLLQRSPAASSDPRALAALRDCRSTFGDAVDLIRQSQAELRQLKTGEEFRWQMSNVETWMSAAETNEDTCTDGFEGVADGPLKADVCARVGSAQEVTSNALALVNSLAAKEDAAASSPAVYFPGRGF
ncbi:hypothetical protein ACLOJK_023716 [Asimina triloba]